MVRYEGNMRVELEFNFKPGFYLKKETLEAFIYEFIEYGEITIYSRPKDCGYYWLNDYTQEELDFYEGIEELTWGHFIEVHTVWDGVRIR